ncbi:BURP domain-containing protein [Drosera capensis]
MASWILWAIAFLLMNLGASHADSAALEAYWKSVLGNTPIPSAIKNNLHHEKSNEAKELLISPTWEYKAGKKSDEAKGLLIAPTWRYKASRKSDKASEKHSEAKELLIAPTWKYKASEKPNEAKELLIAPTWRYKASKKPKKSESNEAEELLIAPTWRYRLSKKSKKSEAYDYDDTVTSLFLLEKDLHIGQKLSLHFPENDNGQNTFMARDIAESLPFSMSKLPQILDSFSIKQGSQEAEFIEQTLENCEKEAVANENYCATSLESMIDYVASSIGKNVNAFSSTVPKDTVMQEYVVLETKKLGDAESAMICHRSSYPYAVFICHKGHAAVPYMVSLVGADGTKVTATAMCHEDTSDWSPEFVGFVALNTKPGTAVCHFLNQYTVLWVRR